MRQPDLVLKMHCDDGECTVKVGLGSLTHTEMAWLFSILEKTERGGSVGFSVETDDHGNQVIKFILDWHGTSYDSKEAAHRTN